MARHLLVDGYNLLGSAGMSAAADRGLLEAAREQLIQRLAAYRRRKGHTITIAFDGWRNGKPTEQREHRAGLEVIYSKRGERADQVIQRLAYLYGSDCAVVSSDHEVAQAARAAGAFVLGAAEFRGKLQEPHHAPTLAHKELDRGEAERTTREKHKGGNPRKLPKSARKRTHRLREF